VKIHEDVVRSMIRQAVSETSAALKEKLYDARLVVLRLAEKNDRDLQILLAGYYDCKNEDAVFGWWYKTIDKIIKKSVILPGNTASEFYEERAMCPLCGEGGSQPYVTGYKLPNGMERHLRGQGQVSGCDVMRIVRDVALDHFREEAKRAK
jgi:hypothetical protein